MTILLIVGLIAALAIGAPIFSVMIGFAMVGAMATGRGLTDLSAIEIFEMSTGNEAATLATIPLFIFAGYIMAEAKTSDRMVRVSQVWLGWMPGGLAVVTVFACAIFTTFTGASGVTIVALGGLLMPSLIKEKYPERFSLGLVTGTGSVGLLFPPALPLIVYAIVYGAVAQTIASAKPGEIELIDFSLERFILAGVVPGLVLCGILCIYAVYVAIKNNVPRTKFDITKVWKPTLVALPELLLPFAIIGGVVKGIELTNLAALATFYVLMLEMVAYRDVKIADIWKITKEAITLVGAIFIIIYAAKVLTNYVVTAEIPFKMVDWIKAHISSKWMFLLMLNLILIIVGMIMDIFSAIVVVVPLLIPAANAFGIDPYHLGVIFLLNLELGYMTPPVGLNLFIASFRFQKSIIEVIRATLPLLGCTALALVLVTYIPALTVVPAKKRKGNMEQLYIIVEQGANNVRKKLASAGWVAEIDLGGGKTIKSDACGKLTDETDKLICNTLFETVTKCKAAEPVDPECAKAAIKTYNDATGDGDDDDDDDDGPEPTGDDDDDDDAPKDDGADDDDDDSAAGTTGAGNDGGAAKKPAAKKPDTPKKKEVDPDEDFEVKDDGAE